MKYETKEEIKEHLLAFLIAISLFTVIGMPVLIIMSKLFGD